MVIIAQDKISDIEHTQPQLSHRALEMAAACSPAKQGSSQAACAIWEVSHRKYRQGVHGLLRQA